MKKTEFHDLAELDLNVDLETGERNSSWGNLGFWFDDSQKASTTITYPQACESLAIKLGKFSNLDKLTNSATIFDTGFGCGDQLLTWHKQFKINNIYGINISESQTELAQENISTLNEISIQQGNACNQSDWSKDLEYDRIIALDCIYHFSNKEQFFQLSKDHLTETGKISITDLVLTNPAISNPQNSWLDSLFLKVICFASHIPFENIKTLEQYEKQLNKLDLTIEQQEDITQQVFIPFSNWVDNNIEQIKQHSPNLPTWKYKGTAFFLRYCARKNILSYRLLNIAHKKA